MCKVHNLITRILYWVYGFNKRRLRRIILKVVARLEGGQLRSTTLRRIFSKYHDVHIGSYSYGGCFDPESLPPGTSVGRYCSFSQFKVLSRNHPTIWLSTHPFFFNPNLDVVLDDILPHTKLAIGNDVWIGYGAVIFYLLLEKMATEP